MRVLGWDLSQIAVAIARYRRIEGGTLPPTIRGLLDLKRWWQSRTIAEPLEVQLEGVKQEKDYEWACEVFCSKPL